jgi:hypothetical protein
VFRRSASEPFTFTACGTVQNFFFFFFFFASEARLLKTTSITVALRGCPPGLYSLPMLLGLRAPVGHPIGLGSRRQLALSVLYSSVHIRSNGRGDERK